MSHPFHPNPYVFYPHQGSSPTATNAFLKNGNQIIDESKSKSSKSRSSHDIVENAVALGLVPTFRSSNRSLDEKQYPFYRFLWFRNGRCACQSVRTVSFWFGIDGSKAIPTLDGYRALTKNGSARDHEGNDCRGCPYHRHSLVSQRLGEE